jgi:uncharacterized protein (DUF2384 family)
MKTSKLVKLHKAAIAAMESKESAKAWLNSPQRIFNGKTPIEYAEEDFKGVILTLKRIEHGIFL